MSTNDLVLVKQLVSQWKDEGATWEPHQIQAMDQAVSLVSNRITTSAVQNCIWSRTQHGTGLNDSRIHSLIWAARASSWPRIIFYPFVQEPKKGGSITSGYTRRPSRSNPEVTINSDGRLVDADGVVEIWINQWYLNDQLRNNRPLALDKMAGTVMHEYGHKMGFHHPATGSYQNDYLARHLVVVAGDCVNTNGAGARDSTGGFSLTIGYDPNERWDRAE